MPNSLLRTDKEIAAIYERHRKAVYRLCYAYMKNPPDTEDAVQETFYQLIRTGPVFESETHEKAWLIRTAANLCKNVLRHWWRKRNNLDDYDGYLQSNGPVENNDTLGAVLELPQKYKTVVYLYYFEGYNSVEIAGILGKPGSTIRNHLYQARKALREKLGGDLK